MAAAATVDAEDESGRKHSPEDEHILHQPYAEAVSFMGYRSELVVHAVKLLQKKQSVIEVGRLMLEVEKLDKITKSGRSLPSLEGEGMPQQQRSGDDGEDQSDNAEHADTRSARGDLQTDGEQPGMQHRNKGSLLPDTTVKKDGLPVVQNQPKRSLLSGASSNESTIQKKRVTEAGLQRKLKALKHENQLLKARQSCRHCHQRPVSITFLPCGHYSYCYECGRKFSACPVCQKTILADVKTFLA